MMEPLPRIIENPITGERVTFLATTEETNGEFVKLDNELAPHAIGVPLHYHLAYTETFEVLKGRLNVCIGTKKDCFVMEEGETAHVPLRTVHRFWNDSDQPTVFRMETRPARGFEKTIRALLGLAMDGKADKTGGPKNLFEVALLIELAETYAPGMPLFLQARIFGALARIARWRGYDPAFSKYTKPEAAKAEQTPASEEVRPDRRGYARPSGLSSGANLATIAALTAIIALFWLRRRRSHSGRER